MCASVKSKKFPESSAEIFGSGSRPSPDRAPTEYAEALRRGALEGLQRPGVEGLLRLILGGPHRGGLKP